MERFDNTIEKLIRGFLRLCRLETTEERVASLLQFFKFCLVGVTNTAVSYGINVLVLALLSPFRLSWDYVAGNVVSFLLSVLWSFYWNNRFVFTLQEGEERNLVKALLKTYASYAFSGLVLSNILSFFWVELLGISKVIAPLINLVVSVPINFLMNKLWAFKSEKQTES